MRIFWAPEIFGKSYGLKAAMVALVADRDLRRAAWTAVTAEDRSLEVDVWALGIIMYGLLDGRFPFKAVSVEVPCGSPW